jgi:nucleotide-binding universal stress UspA family protein
MPATHPLVVVGFDGTPASRAAVSRGIERVGTDGHLVVVRAYEVSADEADGPFHGRLLEDAADEAARSISELAEADPRLDFVDWERVVVEGDPARTLARVAAERDADELIVGTRGADRVGVLLGSVAADLLHLADRPVTVIPARMLRRSAEHVAPPGRAAGRDG